MTKHNYYLDLSFDVDQVTRALHYHIDGPKGTPFKGEGRLAGTFHFNAGDELAVRVRATSRVRDKAKFTITDFTLASIPTLVVRKSYLSLFDRYNATISVADWGIPKRIKDADSDRVSTIIKALHPLEVCAPNGQWQMSGYLSVLVEKRDKNGDKKKTPRLFYFDPEGSTGTGGDITE